MIATAGVAPLATLQIGRSVTRRNRGFVNQVAARVVRGALALVYIVGLVGAVGCVVGSLLAYKEGKTSGRTAAESEAADERAKLVTAHQREKDKLRSDAQAEKAALERAHAERFDTIDTARREAQRALALEQANVARARRERDAAVRDLDRVRSAAFTSAATGDRTEAEDTIGACRARADALGRAADAALRVSDVCSLDLEEAGASVRALKRWADAVESSERAGEVAP